MSAENKSIIDDDLHYLQDRSALYPATLHFTPFSIFAVNIGFLPSFIVLVFPLVDYFVNRDGKVARRYITNFKRNYLLCFCGSLFIRILWYLFEESLIKILLVTLGVSAYVAWHIFLSREWTALLAWAEEKK